MKEILIIGFGASSLNLKALLSGAFTHKTKFHFLDSLDPHFVSKILQRIKLENCITYIISKSGSTFETNILAKIILEMGAKNLRILCGNKNSELAEIVSSFDHEWIDFEGSKSGRFSLLSKPFLDIAQIAGIDIGKLEQGAKSFDSSLASKTAQSWIKHFKEGRRNWVIMLYSKQLYGLYMWIRQIISESIGKNGFGIMPFLCEGSMDEHSQLQLFLDGPKDKFYEVVYCDYPDEPGILSESQRFRAEKVISMLQEKNLPTESLYLEEVDEFIIGQKIAFYLELVRIIGEEMGFDPYNQPAVESTKKRHQ